jgi:hypothetical protein
VLELRGIVVTVLTVEMCGVKVELVCLIDTVTRILLGDWLIGIQFSAGGRDASFHLLSEDTGGFFPRI